ncbi:complex I NDUFA9 subunit family protein [Sphingomicrobium clamense]|nr:complex I NDUFA9 subunit family protein [Sphingomicrobium sp. B8]
MTNSNRIVTVFGGGGFIGMPVCEALLKQGVRLRVAQRHPKRAHDLQPLGGVGQVMLMAADITRPDTVARAVEGADAVINLVGTFDGNLDAIHVTGAKNIAEAAKKAGASSLVHLSAIGVDEESESHYSRTKALGEQAVRKAYKGATIIKPSVVFGANDDFTNRFASLARFPMLPVLKPETKFQPVWVRDLALAIAGAALDPKTHGGKSYEVGGPEVLTMHELNRKIADMAGLSPAIVDLPDAAGSLMSKFGFLPGAPITRDQWIMLQSDNVAANNKWVKAFGVDPSKLETIAPRWLGRFTPGGRFAHRRSSENA